MSAMTLEQVRDWHLARDREQRAVGFFIGATDHAGMAATIDAHITQPAQSVDVGAIREVIAELKAGARSSCYTSSRAAEFAWADKLTAALQEKTNDKTL